MKLSKTQIKIITAAFIAAMFLGVYGSFFITIKNKNNHISELKNQVDIEVRKDHRLYSVKSLLTDLNKEIKQIDTYLVADDGVVDFLEDLENLGSIADVSVSVNSVSVDKKTTEMLPFELLKVEFVTRGKWRSVVQLMSLLETSSLGIIINRVHLEKLSSLESWQSNISFTVLKSKVIE